MGGGGGGDVGGVPLAWMRNRKGGVREGAFGGGFFWGWWGEEYVQKNKPRQSFRRSRSVRVRWVVRKRRRDSRALSRVWRSVGTHSVSDSVSNVSLM